MGLNINAECIDVRDVIERIEGLEEILLSAFNEQQVIEGDDTETDDPMDGAFREWCKVTLHDDSVEYLKLCNLIDELSGNGGDELWRGEWFPITLISQDYFVEYAKELLTDCGDLPKEIPHYIEIDWQKTAENIAVDYSVIDFNEKTFFYR